MKKTILIATAATAALALSACSPKAQNESTQAANTMVSDMNATAADAINDVDVATGNALDSAANTMDNAGAAAGNAADKLKAAAGNAMTDAGKSMKK